MQAIEVGISIVAASFTMEFYRQQPYRTAILVIPGCPTIATTVKREGYETGQERLNRFRANRPLAVSFDKVLDYLIVDKLFDSSIAVLHHEAQVLIEAATRIRENPGRS